ncbi:MAG TPA: hypothetical protein VNC50_07060, partial [Planctomycetia bacterium]|nr:hypothetical protein [Planctomycetia bacterium]
MSVCSIMWMSFTLAAGEAATTFIGRLEGAPESARIAVVMKGGKFIAYACSRDAAFNQKNSVWLGGEAAAGELKSEQAGVSFEAKSDGRSLAGTLRQGGESLAFTAKPAKRQAAGLYRATDSIGGADFVLGWIVDDEFAAVGSCTNKKYGGRSALDVRKLQAALARAKKKAAEEEGEKPADEGEERPAKTAKVKRKPAVEEEEKPAEEGDEKPAKPAKAKAKKKADAEEEKPADEGDEKAPAKGAKANAAADEEEEESEVEEAVQASAEEDAAPVKGKKETDPAALPKG